MLRVAAVTGLAAFVEATVGTEVVVAERMVVEGVLTKGPVGVLIFPPAPTVDHAALTEGPGPFVGLPARSA